MAAPRPPTPQILETVSTRPALETRRRTLSRFARKTGSARGNGNARSPSPSPSRVISFWASPKSELIPLSSRINSAVNPLLIRCYGGRVSPVRAEFIAGSRRGERGFATISLPRGFCSSRGGRRSAMPSQLENPMMISLFENNNVCHDYFSHSERLRMLIRGGWRMANGDAERTIRYSLLERPPGRNPRAPATPSADRPRCPIAPCRASKGLKMLKTTRASYWLELASIWDRRHVRLGSAPPRLRRRYARNDGKHPCKWERSEPVALAKSRH